MTTKQIVDNFVNTIADTVQTVFTAPATQNVIIEAVTAANNSIVNASYKAYIVSPLDKEFPQRPLKIVTWGEIDVGIGIVNHTIPAGGSLRFETSAIDSIYFTVTGREVDT